MYSGDLDPKEGFKLLQDDPHAELIDVRTAAEWAFVGLPDLDTLGKRVHRVSWQTYPSMALNQGFAQAVAELGVTPDQPLIFICRSGQRSRAAAETMTAAGYPRCFNLAEGFEGNCDAQGHRGGLGGWKCAGLPWKQT